MAVAFDAASTGYNSGASSLTISHTVGSGSDRALVVAVACINSTDFLASATVTYGGVSMGSPVVTKSAGTGNNYVYVWALANPATGTANVVITPSGSAYLKAVVSSYTGVDQTTPVSNSAKYTSSFAPSPVSVSITVGTDGMAVDFICVRNSGRTITPHASQTRLGSQINGTLSTNSGSYKANATAMEWTHSGGTENVSIAIVALAAASGGGAIEGDLGATEAADVAALTGDVIITGTIAATESADTAAFSGGSTPVTGDLDATEASDTAAATGTVRNPRLVIGPLKNNTGTLLASETGATVYVYQTSGAHVVTKSSQTTDGSAIMTVSDAALAAGTTYRFVIALSGGAEGMDKLAAA